MGARVSASTTLVPVTALPRVAPAMASETVR